MSESNEEASTSIDVVGDRFAVTVHAADQHDFGFVVLSRDPDDDNPEDSPESLESPLKTGRHEKVGAEVVLLGSSFGASAPLHAAQDPQRGHWAFWPRRVC